MLFTLFLPLVLATTVSPVQKVIELLDDLKSKVENDLANEEKMMEEFTQWCDETANEKEDAITSSKRTIQDLSAAIEDASAGIQTLTSTIDELTGKISTSEGDLKKATSIREGEQKDFVAAEKELVDTVDSLSRATSVLKKNLGFLQSGRVAKNLGLLASGLSKVVEASWVTAHQKAVLQSLIQTQDQDEDLSFQPQATTQAYESKSGGILDTIADMQEKAEESLSNTRQEETQAAHAYQMVKQGLEDETSVMKKQLSEATQERSRTEQELHGAKEELSETQKTLAEDEKYLSELNQSCKQKASDWAVRQKSAGEETAAIEKAKGILSDGVKVLLQTGRAMTTTKQLDEDLSVRNQVVQALRGLAQKFKGFGLVQLAQRARSDPFGKIRGLVETMITRLEKEAAEEATQKAFCDEELSESKAKQASLTGKLDKTSARQEKAEADKAMLKEAITTLESELAEMAAGEAEATKVRQEEHAEYLKSSKDFKDSAEAVAKAMAVLNEYYNSASFLQLSSKTRRAGAKAGPDFGGAKGDVGSTIVSVLEVAESDFTQLLAEAEAAESEAQSSYDKLVQENAVARATKEADAKGKQSEVKNLEVAIGNYKEDKASTGSELDAVLDYLDKLKPQCETKVMSYAEKKAAREQEISGLKEALEILAADASFVQLQTVRRA
jgi:chromosome segregation ATPase